MTLPAAPESDASLWGGVAHLEQRLKDYVAIGRKLIWQRQAIFLAATVLGATYYDAKTAITCYLGVVATEAMDIVLNNNILRWNDHDPKTAQRFLYLIIATTLASAGAISLFVIQMALQETTGGHFTPMLFLFAASLFAAMNNHQVMPALIVRLIIYGGTFLYIALMDIIATSPPMTAQPWLQFFTAIFVLYFILDISFVFLKLYRRNLKQMDDLRDEHEIAVRAYEVKSKFLSTVSHELRTPLTSIKASIDLINMGLVGPLPEKVSALMQNAGKNSKRLADLINDLLDVQKIEAGEMVYHFAEVNARDLVLESVDANRGLADQLGIGIECAFPTPDASFEGDEARLMQVMANLISNALKFSQRGVSIQISVASLGRKVRISVRDHGVGIAPESRDLVFGKFTQVDSSDQRRVGGTGLGMHISKQIVERHGGLIDYDSEVGHGTTFFVEFPELLADQSMKQSAA